MRTDPFAIEINRKREQRQPALPTTGCDGRQLGMLLVVDILDAWTASRAVSGPEPEPVSRVPAEWSSGHRPPVPGALETP
jgi:hypothetical protein